MKQLQQISFKKQNDAQISVQVKVFLKGFHVIFLDIETDDITLNAYKRKFDRSYYEDYLIEVLIWKIRKEIIQTKDWYDYKDIYNLRIENIVEQNISIEKKRLTPRSPHPTHF